MSNNKIQIGWYTLKKDEVFTNSFETAAWYEDVLVPAGKYPIYAYDVHYIYDGRMTSHIDGAYVCMEGTITSDYFGALFCGVPISGYDHEKNKGKSAKTSFFTYLSGVAEAVISGDDRYELLPEFIAKAQEPRTYKTMDFVDGELKEVEKTYIPALIFRRNYDGIHIFPHG